MDASPQRREPSPPTNSDPYLPESSPQTPRSQSYTSSSESSPPRSSPHSARKRWRSNSDDPYLPDSSPPSAKKSKSSPLRQHESPPLRAPMPQHTQIPGILRAQSPFAGHHVSAQAQLSTTTVLGPGNPNGRPPQLRGSLGRSIHIPKGPLPYSYGSSVSLDPALLSPEPYPPAIAAIKQAIHSNKGKTIEEMISALEVHGRGTGNAPVPTFDRNQMPTSQHKTQTGALGNYATGVVGSAFDEVLNDFYAESGKGGGSQGSAGAGPEEEHR